MSIQIGIEGPTGRSIDYNYNYWNDFAEWVASVRPDARSLIWKAPNEGAWLPSMEGVAPDAEYQGLTSLVQDLRALRALPGKSAHDTTVADLLAIAEEALRAGKALECS